MIGKLKEGKIIYDNPYSMYNFDFYGAMNPDMTRIPTSIDYEVHNPRKIVLEEGASYEFEVIYLEDGQIAEIFDKVQQEEPQEAIV